MKMNGKDRVLKTHIEARREKYDANDLPFSVVSVEFAEWLEIELEETRKSLLVAVKALGIIADPKAELPDDGRCLERIYQDISIDCLREIGWIK